MSTFIGHDRPDCQRDSRRRRNKHRPDATPEPPVTAAQSIRRPVVADGPASGGRPGAIIPYVALPRPVRSSPRQGRGSRPGCVRDVQVRRMVEGDSGRPDRRSRSAGPPQACLTSGKGNNTAGFLRVNRLLRKSSIRVEERRSHGGSGGRLREFFAGCEQDAFDPGGVDPSFGEVGVMEDPFV
jgi:hypothetical protein